MPVDRITLERELAQVPDSARWLSRPEAAQLATILNTGERVQLGATAWLVESGKLAIRTWLVVATSERLLCLLKGGPEGMRKLQLPLSEMKSAHTDARLGYYEVTIAAEKKKVILSGMPKDSAVALSAALSALIAQQNKPAVQSTPAAVMTTSSSADSGDDLAALRGKVSALEAELQQTKQRLAAVEQVIRNAQARAAAKT